MQSHFGARLREHRERQGIAIETVAGKTKIKVSLLESLERGDLSHWPVGLYRRAYLRSYAQAIGLDPDAIVREALDLFPEPVEPIEPPPRRGLRGLVGALSRGRHVANASSAATVPAHAIPAVERPATSPVPPPLSSPAPAAVDPPPSVPETPAPPVAESPAPTRAPQPAREPDIDLLAAARLCTELGRAAAASDVEPLLREAARILGARGVIVWLWDALSSELRPVLAYGYSTRTLAQLPALGRDADNVTAAAFRAGQPFAINGNGTASGALAVPLLTPTACAGVLAIELPHGREEAGTVRAVATFFAAVLAQLVGGPQVEEAAAR